jgi:acetyl esterase/lipase
MRTAIVAALALLSAAASAPADEPITLPLWPDGAPGAKGNAPGEDAFHAGDVPTLTVFLPPKDRATGAAFVICPGGGYGFLATEHEGTEVAQWLNSLGVAGIMLKYRLGPKYQHPAMLQDAQRAIRTVRAKAGDWGVDPKRVGVLGFSAGGHLASTVSTHFDAGKADADDPVERQSCRPDLSVLVYPVIALSTEYGHTGSLKNLLGDNPSEEQINNLSNEKQVTKDTPPTFLAHTNEDAGVPAENSLLYVLALRKAGVPVELHLFEKGQHGLGLGTGWASHNIPAEPNFREWPGLCAGWLKAHGFLDRAPARP